MYCGTIQMSFVKRIRLRCFLRNAKMHPDRKDPVYWVLRSKLRRSEQALKTRPGSTLLVVRYLSYVSTTFFNFGPACSAIFLQWSFGEINQLELFINLDIYGQ